MIGVFVIADNQVKWALQEELTQISIRGVRVGWGTAKEEKWLVTEREPENCSS